ncbi:MAG TPA: (4Fe-4S)-binding protein [Lachnospiraceae bacterium]|nr:(4Fe-4S)-binding protein [Lachnospiraceae bacterium]
MLKRECTGCMACYNACPNGSIKMKMDFEGCTYPYINSRTCIQCGKCRAVCPALQKGDKQQPEQTIVSYVGYCTDEKIRRTSSSGAVFPLAAKWCIDKGGTVFGARYDGIRVIHSHAETMEAVGLFKGSKYVQSNIGITYRQAREALEKGKYVLYTGLPCQIEGLKAYLKKEYERLYTIDLICHGVGAPGIWEKYIKVFHRGKKIKHIDFKNKDAGWNKEQLVIQYANGGEYRRFPLDDYYDYGFNQNIFLRSSCYDCQYKGFNRKSDLTIGDAWGVEKYAPRFRDDKGCSLVFVHSKRGKELFEEISKKMKCEAVDGKKAVQYNQRMISSVPETPKRKEFYENLRKYSFRLSMMMTKGKKNE